MIIKEQIFNEAREKLVALYNPIAIYIFGSYAWGQPCEESDLDILVIIDKDTKDRHTTLVNGHRALKNMSVPKDLLVITYEEFEAASSSPSSFYGKIKKMGKQIYARA